MKTTRIYWILQCLVLCLSVTYAQKGGQNLCEDGWQYFMEFGGSSMCFRAVTTPLPWRQAQEYCQRDIAHLVNMDPITKFYPFSEVDDPLPQYIFGATNGEFWSGMHVQNGRLMWDAYGPEFVRNSFSKSWDWAPSQPSLPEAEACGQVYQGRRIIPSTNQPPLEGSGNGELLTTETPPTTTVREEYNGQNTMKLSLCTDALPFVCQKPTIQQDVNIVSNCPAGWLGSPYIPYCFRIIKDPLPYEDAKKACQGTYEGEMIQATPRSFNATLSTYVLRYYLINDTYFQNTTVPTVWIDGGPVNIEGVAEPDKCYAVKEEVDVGLLISTDDCVNPQPYICVIHSVRQERISFEVTSPFLSQKELRSETAFAQFPITAIFARPPNDNEKIFIKTPTRYINSSFGYSHRAERFPEKLTFRYNITESDRTGSQSYEVQVWLPAYISSNNQPSARKRREAESTPSGISHGKTVHTKVSNYGGSISSRYSSGIDRHDKHLMMKMLTDFMSKKHKRKLAHKKNKRYNVRKSHYTVDEKSGTHYSIHGMKRAKNQAVFQDIDLVEKHSKRYKHSKNHEQKSKKRLHGKLKRKNHFKQVDMKNNVKGIGRNGKLSINYYLAENSGGSSHRVKRGLPPIEDGFSDIPDLINEARNEVLVDFSQLYFTTGYYSFGVYTINPPSYVETNPILVRFAEQDWFIYVITIDVSSTSQVFRPEQITSFNLYGDSDYIGTLNEIAASAMRSTPTIKGGNIEGNIPNIIRSYRAIPESFSGNTIKFRAYMNVFGSRSFNSEMEQTMLLVVEQHWRDKLPSDGQIFVSGSLNVRSTVACPTEKVDINGVTITFPVTPSGETAFSWDRCIGGGGSFASRTCLGGYDNGVVWGEIVLATGCEPFPVLPESTSTVDLKKLSEVILNTTNFNQVLNDTIRLTAPDVNLTEADIIYTAEILYNFWNFEVAQPTILDDIYEIANNVLVRIPEIIDAAQRITNAANRIIESVEEITSNADLLGMKSLRVIKSFLATNIWDQDGAETPIIGLKFHNENDDDDDDDEILDNMDLINVETPSDTLPNITDTAIYLDPELFEGRPTRAVYQIYSKTTLFEKVNSRFELISKVAAARLEVDNILITDLGNNSVVVIFRTSKDDDRTICAFWDYRADEGAGGWATDGCNKTIMEDKRVRCECNHLTNFAVLIDLEAYTISDTDKLILEIVTKVGLSISIIGLGLTILTFIIFKHLRSGRGQQVLINLAVSMICSAIIFLVGMDRTESVVGCKVVAALLHYFILVSFMWMLVEGILQYLRFVKVLGTYIPNFMLKTMIPAWGIPILPVVIVAAIDHDLYYGGNGYCWLARDAMLYGFIIPVAAILLANVIVFCLVMVNLLRRRSNSMKSNQSERKMAYLHFQAAVSIFVILGLTWVFGFLAIDGARIIFHYIFAILNAFQGFFIFLLFTVREKQIRKAWKKMCCKDKASKLGSSSTGTDVPRRATRSSDATYSTTASKSSNGHSENGRHKRNIEFSNIGYEHN